MPLNPIQKLQLHNQIERVLHVKGNYQGGILEMAVVIDCAYEREAAKALCADIISTCKKQSEVFRNVRLNMILWGQDEISASVTASAYVQTGVYFDQYDHYEAPDAQAKLSGWHQGKTDTQEKASGRYQGEADTRVEVSGRYQGEADTREKASGRYQGEADTRAEVSGQYEGEAVCHEHSAKQDIFSGIRTEKIMEYLKKFHARSKLIFLVTPDSDRLIKAGDPDRILQAMNPFLKQKLILVFPERIEAGTELYRNILLSAKHL